MNSVFTIANHYFCPLFEDRKQLETHQEHVYLLHMPSVFTAYLKVVDLLKVLLLQHASVTQLGGHKNASDSGSIQVDGWLNATSDKPQPCSWN